MTLSGQGHSVSCSTRDFDFFYEGLERGQLLVQRCEQCGQLRNPPSPMCMECGAFEWAAEAMSGRGTIFSYTVVHRPPLPHFEMPHPVGLITLDEGIRFVGGLEPIAPDDLAIGLRVDAVYSRRNGIATVSFQHRAETIL